MSATNVEETWELKAACRGPYTDLFFPPDHFEKKTEREFRERQAKAICAECPAMGRFALKGAGLQQFIAAESP